MSFAHFSSGNIWLFHAASRISGDLISSIARRKSALGVVSHDTKKHRRDQIFEDGFDFTLAAAREEMAKLEGGFDKTKARALLDSKNYSDLPPCRLIE